LKIETDFRIIGKWVIEMKIVDFLTNQEITFLKQFLTDFDEHLSIDDEQFLEIEEQIDDLYVQEGFDENYNLNSFGSKIEPIVDKFGDM
jgi:hypothetical protein